MIPGRVYQLVIGSPDAFLVVTVNEFLGQERLMDGALVVALNSIHEYAHRILMANGRIGIVHCDDGCFTLVKEGST